MEAGVQESGNGLTVLEVLLGDRCYVAGLNATVPGVVGRDAHSGTGGALPLTVASADKYARWQRGCLERRQHLSGAAALTGAVLAYEHAATLGESDGLSHGWLGFQQAIEKHVDRLFKLALAIPALEGGFVGFAPVLVGFPGIEGYR